MTFPGGLLIGCDAGTLNAAKIKGSHTAMWSGILAAESLFEALRSEDSAVEISEYTARFKNSDLYRELHKPEFQRRTSQVRILAGKCPCLC